MKIQELLTEAKVKMRDTKGTRDKAEQWVLEQGEPFTDRATKDASVMNSLVATLAKVAGKKMKAGKYSLTVADFKKIEQAKFTVENLNKTIYKKITSFVGGGKPHNKIPKQNKVAPKATKTPTPKVDEEIKFGMDYENGEIKLNGVTIVKIEEYHTTNYPDAMEKIITTLLSKDIYNKLRRKVAWRPAGALFQDNGVYNFVGGDKKSKQSSFVEKALEKILVELSNMANVKEGLVNNGYTKLTASVKPPEKRKTPTKAEKDNLINEMASLLSGTKHSNSIEYSKEERIFMPEAIKKAQRQAEKLGKFFNFNRPFDLDSGEHDDPEWSDFAPKWESYSFRPKDEYKHILKKIGVSAHETGDYAGDYTEYSVTVIFN